MHFGTWSHTTNELNMTVTSRTINLDSYQESTLFSIKNTTSHRSEYRTLTGETYVQVSFGM